MLSSISRFIPEDFKKQIKKILLRGNRFFCPVCETPSREFLPYGVSPRPEAQCPMCGSLERHRLLWLYFINETDLFDPPRKKMLHIAPEECFSERLKKNRNIDYLTADISNRAMVKMDIMDIGYPDGAFDVIYCCHVLEHVEDDRKAMRELARVLKPGGWAVLQVPLEAVRTFEDPAVTDPLERERLFGQSDHVRVYGPDYKERLEESGFKVTVVDYYNRFDEATLGKFALRYERDDIYLCRLS
jgi:SAM-dependent methyltransferase